MKVDEVARRFTRERVAEILALPLDGSWERLSAEQRTALQHDAESAVNDLWHVVKGLREIAGEFADLLVELESDDPDVREIAQDARGEALAEWDEMRREGELLPKWSTRGELEVAFFGEPAGPPLSPEEARRLTDEAKAMLVDDGRQVDTPGAGS